MPELPEIETIRTHLEPRVIGHAITRVRLKRANLRRPLPRDLNERITNRCILTVRRRAKYLLVDLAGCSTRGRDAARDDDLVREGGLTLIIHLGMSGRLFFTSPRAPEDRHDHVLIDFDNGQHLRLRDPRRFGLLDVVRTVELAGHSLFCHLGVEPLSVDFNADHLAGLCRGSKAPIKNILMNAHKVVGVGNIYANEALFLAGIRPTRPGRRVRVPEIERLCTAVKQVLTDSITAGGTTFRDYVDVDENPGLYQLRLMVYDREGFPCQTCAAPIRRTVQVGRSSFFCPRCQK
jgi:formamidopyrimidine-DNA glycosylase